MLQGIDYFIPGKYTIQLDPVPFAPQLQTLSVADDGSDPEILQDKSCVICQGSLTNPAVSSSVVEKTVSAVTHCGHRYHKRCLRDWIKRRPTCPCCYVEFHVIDEMQLHEVAASRGAVLRLNACFEPIHLATKYLSFQARNIFKSL